MSQHNQAIRSAWFWHVLAIAAFWQNGPRIFTRCPSDRLRRLEPRLSEVRHITDPTGHEERQVNGALHLGPGRDGRPGPTPVKPFVEQRSLAIYKLYKICLQNSVNIHIYTDIHIRSYKSLLLAYQNSKYFEIHRNPGPKHVKMGSMFSVLFIPTLLSSNTARFGTILNLLRDKLDSCLIHSMLEFVTHREFLI